MSKPVAKSGRMPSNTRPPHPKVPNPRRKTSDMHKIHGLAVVPQPRRNSGKMPPRVKNGPMDWGASKIPHYPDPRQEARHG